MKDETMNPFAARVAALRARLAKRRLDAALVHSPADVRSLTGIDCDSACLVVGGERMKLFTDFRYVPAVHRLAPWLSVGDLRKLDFAGRRAGVSFALSHDRFERLRKAHRGVKFADIADDLAALRAVKTSDELAAIARAAELNDRIWREAASAFAPGMTEREMARLIRHLMVEYGDGEAFETIVCVGANAAECHHVPDDTVWNGRDGVLVDMGVRLGGVCSDMTRNLRPARASAAYRRVFDLVAEANRAGVAAARPGITAGELDAVARGIIRRGGFGRAFGHSLGHGVGYEIHEAPTVRRRDRTVLKPGMVITVEPGIYLEGNLGVRIEDLVVITDDGCRVLSSSPRDGRRPEAAR